MTIISFVNQKGGCSKSTTCVHFAYWLTSLENPIASQVIQSADDLLEQIPVLAKDVDYLLVDGSAGISETTRAILLRSDLAIVPCQPTGVDLMSAADAVKLIRQAQSVRGGLPKAAMFLSRGVKGTKLLDEAVQVLQQTGLPVLKTVIFQRQAIADCFGQACTIWELPGKAATESAKEYEALFKEVMKALWSNLGKN